MCLKCSFGCKLRHYFPKMQKFFADDSHTPVGRAGQNSLCEQSGTAVGRWRPGSRSELRGLFEWALDAQRLKPRVPQQRAVEDGGSSAKRVSYGLTRRNSTGILHISEKFLSSRHSSFHRWIFRYANYSYLAVGEPKFAECFSSDEAMAEPTDRFARSLGRKIGTQSGGDYD